MTDHQRDYRPDPGYFDQPLAAADGEVWAAVAGEARRQAEQIELIASENLVSLAVRQAMGSMFCNKTVEGYPGKRYYGGAEFADAVERIAIERACRLFDCAYANVQPHSGSGANQAVLLALLKPGERILSMDLSAGGHLSHGHPANLSGRWFDVAHYGVRREDQRIDYDALGRLAERHRPQLIIAGGSAYPGTIDFARIRVVADAVGAWFLADMAHFAGLVAAGLHPDPLPHADVVTTTTYKSLRGARGGLILAKGRDLAARLDRAVFPGVQGSVQLHGVAAKAVCLGEALKPAFKVYNRQVLANAAELASALQAAGVRLVGGGTETGLMLVDLRPLGLDGECASVSLEAAGLTCNKNMVPFDSAPPQRPSGLRLSVNAGTARGFDGPAFHAIGGHVARVLHSLVQAPDDNRKVEAEVRVAVAHLCQSHPIDPGPAA